MAITKNINRQTRLHAYVDFTIADIGAGASGSHNAIHLPAGARLLSGFLEVTEDTNDGDALTVSVGDSVGTTPDVDRYLAATSVNATGTKVVPFTLTPVKGAVIPAGGAWVTVTVAAVDGDADEGTFRLGVDYVVEDRVTEYEPYRG
jgi:hypothetical protein